MTSETKPQNIPNIITLKSYLADDTGYWKRLALLAGTSFGLMIGFASFFTLRSTPNLLMSPLTGAVFTTFFGGLFFGTFFPIMMRRKTNWLKTSLYNGADWISNSLPSGFQALYQIPCSQVDGALGIGGVFYAGQDSFLFVPHKLNGREIPPVTIYPLATVTTELAPPDRQTSIRKLLIPHPQPHLILAWQSGQIRLAVPQPATIRNKIESTLQLLRSLNA